MTGITELLEMSGQGSLETEIDPGQNEQENLADGAEETGEELSGSEVEGSSESEASKETKRQRVPLGALQEERARRQNLEQQNAQLQERFMKTLELLQQSQAKPEPQKQEPEVPPPVFAEDPEGYINWLSSRYDARVRQLEQQLQGQQANVQQTHQHQQLLQHISAQEAQFSQSVPDYQPAVEYFMTSKNNEYAALGLDPYTVQQMVQRDFMGIAQFAAQNNKNAAQLVYETAKARGYKGGTQTAPTRKTSPKPAPSSLSNLSGGVGEDTDTGDMSLEKMKSMSDAEFNKWFDQQARKHIQGPSF